MPFRLMGWNPRSTHPMPSNIRGSNLDISTQHSPFSSMIFPARNLYLVRAFPSLPCWMTRTHPPVWSCVQLFHAPPTTYSFIPSLPVLGSSGHLLQMAQGNIQWRLEANKRPPASDVSAGLGTFTRKETPKKQNPRVNPSYPPFREAITWCKCQVPTREQKCLASLRKGKGESNQAARASRKQARSRRRRSRRRRKRRRRRRRRRSWSNYTQQVVQAASVKVPSQKQES